MPFPSVLVHVIWIPLYCTDRYWNFTEYFNKYLWKSFYSNKYFFHKISYRHCLLHMWAILLYLLSILKYSLLYHIHLFCTCFCEFDLCIFILGIRLLCFIFLWLSAFFRTSIWAQRISVSDINTWLKIRYEVYTLILVQTYIQVLAS